MSLIAEARSRRPRVRVPDLGNWANAIKFAIVLIVVNSHTLTNLSLPLYLLLYVPTMTVVGLQFAFRFRDADPPIQVGWFAGWIAVAFFVLAVSIVMISPGGAAQGFVRFMFAAPIFLALTLYTDNEEDVRRHVAVAAAFFAIASLSIPLQFFTGPITWFADSSERSGLVRYSSLVGNLTSIGIVVGSYIVLTQVFSKRTQWIWLGLMIVPAMLALQKAAVVNIAFGLLIVVILNRRAWRKFAIAIGSFATAVILAYLFVPFLRERIAASLLSFGFAVDADTHVYNDDLSIGVAIWDRLVTLPLANFQALVALHDPLVFLTGGGFGMASTALVPAGDSIAPMAHNQFAELLTVSGPLAGTIQLVILGAIGVILAKRMRSVNSPVVSAVFFAYLILMVNSFFANGSVYQPSSATIFYIAFFVASSRIFAPAIERAFVPVTGSDGLRAKGALFRQNSESAAR